MSAELLLRLKAALPREYSVDGYLGTGGQGTVFSGTLNGERVALKLFRPCGDDRRLRRELQLLEAIACPYVVKLRRFEQITLDDTVLSLVAYEFLSGGDLRQFLDPQKPPIDAQTLITIGVQMGVAIDALWQRRIVHRDIKPANIVKAGEHRYVLVDVGLARHLDRSDLTTPGLAPGTLGYLSPEQAQGRRNLTIHSDVFSLGITLYEIAIRRHPFNRVQFLVGMPLAPPLAQFRSDLPNGLTRLIHQMLAVVPAQRPSKVHELFEQLAGG